MKLVKIDCCAHDVMFVCEFRNTRHGFAHDVTMFVDGREQSKATCHYLNRTWERWNYQSACISAARKLKDEAIDDVLTTYKWENHLQRLTAKRRQEAMDKALADHTVVLMDMVIKMLDKNLY